MFSFLYESEFQDGRHVVVQRFNIGPSENRNKKFVAEAINFIESKP